MALDGVVKQIDIHQAWKEREFSQKQKKLEDLLFNLGKTIQVYVDKKPYLRISVELDKWFHDQILRDFFEECEARGETLVEDIDKIPIERIPRNGERYSLVGMGMVLMRPNHFHFFGDSYGYNLHINEKHLKEISNQLEDHKIDYTYKKIN
jgi:hypothetical protein